MSEDEFVKLNVSSTYIIHSLITHVLTKYSIDDTRIGSSYVIHLNQMINDHIKTNKANNGYGSIITIKDLLTIHSRILEGMGIIATTTNSNNIAYNDGLNILMTLSDNDNDDNDEETESDSKYPSYGKALRFAINKSLKPGMSFVNGIVLPTTIITSDKSNEGDDNDDDVDIQNLMQKGSQIFMQEQQYVYGLIAQDIITDTR